MDVPACEVSAVGKERSGVLSQIDFELELWASGLTSPAGFNTQASGRLTEPRQFRDSLMSGAYSSRHSWGISVDLVIFLPSTCLVFFEYHIALCSVLRIHSSWTQK